MATETKSGRLVKTPEKFSSCVSGKRKLNKTRNCHTSPMSSLSVQSSAADLTTSSIIVNTSQDMSEVQGDETFEVTDNTLTTLTGFETTIQDTNTTIDAEVTETR